MKTKSLLILLSFLLVGMKVMAAVGDMYGDESGIEYKVTSESPKKVTVTGLNYTPTSNVVVAIPDQVTFSSGTTYTVTAIADNAFKSKKVESVVLPTTLTTIGEMAFYNTQLQAVRIPASVTSVGSYAFASCTSLQYVYWYLADNVSLNIQSNNDYFSQCTSLTKIYLFGTKWASVSYWPKSAASQVSYYVANDITSLKSNVTSNGIRRNYVFYLSGDFYAGTKENYLVGITGISGFYQQDNTSSLKRQQLNMTVANTSIMAANNDDKYFYCKKAGSTTVAIKYRGVTLVSAAEATVTANNCTGITLSESSKTMVVGESFGLNATVTAEHGTVGYAGATYSSSDESVATVTNLGRVAAVDAGTATITYTATSLSGTNTATCTVTVKEPNISNLKLNGGTPTVTSNLDKVSSLTLTPTFDSETTKNYSSLKWTSSDETVAKVQYASTYGENTQSVRLINMGTATITCSHTNTDGKVVSASIQLTNTRPNISNLQLSQDTYQIKRSSSSVEISASFDAAVDPGDVELRWSVADNTIVQKTMGSTTGTHTNRLIPNNYGTTTVTVSHTQGDGTMVSATATVIIADYFTESFTLTPSSQTLPLGQTLTLTPKVSGDGLPATLTYTWESSNTKVATVDNDGKVTALSYGSALITCHLAEADMDATCKVTVCNPNLIYVGNIFYKMSADGKSLEVTNCAGGDPEYLMEESYEYAGTVNVPATVTHDGTEYEVTAIGKYAFYNQVDLQALTIPTSVKVFDVSSCEGAINLARILFKSKAGGLLRINDRAFYGCKKLDQVDLPNTTTGIYKYAFQNCDALEDITLSTSLNIIDEFAFADCKALNNVNLPESLRNIQNYAFQNDKALEAIVLPSKLQGLGTSAFEDCNALKEVTFLTASDQEFTVGADAFLGTAVERVNIAHLDSWIGINFSNPAANPASISHHIYQGSSEIINAIVPEGPVAMNNNVFYGCSALKTLQLPSTLGIVNDNTLNGCTSLETVYVRATSVPGFIGTLGTSGMSDVFNKAQLIVPTGKESKYKSDTKWWGLFKTITGSLTDAQCAKPTITYSGGKLVFSCATAGVDFVYDVKVADAKNGSGNNVAMSTVYQVSVYATKAGLANSDIVTQDITVGGSGSDLKGDVDGDGSVDVNDVQTTINIILGK